MIPSRGVYDDNGYTRIRIWLGPRFNLDGTENRPYRKTMGPWTNPNIQRANNHVAEVRRNFQNGIRPEPELESLGVPLACDIYHKRWWADKRGRSAEGIKNVGYKMNFIRTYWKARAWHTLRSSDVEAYMLWRKNQKGKKGAPIQDGTVDNELNILSSMFTMIGKWNNRREIGPYLLPTDLHGVSYNPVQDIERDSLIGTKRERTATREELLKAKVYCDNNDPEMLVMIERSITTGLRKTDLEKVNGLADVRGVLSKTKEKKLFRMPVDFSRRINYKNFDRRWDALRLACGMMDFHWHDWRHVAGTMLSLLGFSDEDIQKFYNHSSVQQTRDYINTGKERLRPQVEGLKAHLKDIWKDAPPVVPPDHSKKVCRGCSEPKPLEAYGKHSAFKSGLNSRCRACCYKATVDQRSKNPSLRVVEYAKYKDPRRSPSSAVEHSLHMGGVVGSNPSETTISKQAHSVPNSVPKYDL